MEANTRISAAAGVSPVSGGVKQFNSRIRYGKEIKIAVQLASIGYVLGWEINMR